jgi:hypothetical protein
LAVGLEIAHWRFLFLCSVALPNGPWPLLRASELPKRRGSALKSPQNEFSRFSSCSLLKASRRGTVPGMTGQNKPRSSCQRLRPDSSRATREGRTGQELLSRGATALQAFTGLPGRTGGRSGRRAAAASARSTSCLGSSDGIRIAWQFLPLCDYVSAGIAGCLLVQPAVFIRKYCNQTPFLYGISLADSWRLRDTKAGGFLPV